MQKQYFRFSSLLTKFSRAISKGYCTNNANLFFRAISKENCIHNANLKRVCIHKHGERIMRKKVRYGEKTMGKTMRRDKHYEYQEMTYHARKRMNSRNITQQAIDAVFKYGRRIFTRGAIILAIGRKEVARYLKKEGVELKQYEGIQIVCGSDLSVITVYRNHDFSSLRSK